MSLFGRQVILDIGTEGATGKSFSDFRISFKVEMDRSREPNKAKIEAYNLSPDTIALAQKEDSIVRLTVGYDVPLQIFRGNPIQGGVTLEKRGPDRVLVIEAQDGQRNIQEARLNVSYATDTKFSKIIADITEQLGLPEGTIEADDITLSQGVVLTGPAADVLDSVCESLGVQWFIRDGVLQIISSDETTGESSIVFSSVTGNLVGIPKKKDTGVEIVGLISPSLRPGKPFRVESENVNGNYIVDSLIFTGDSGFSNDFYVSAVGVTI